MRKKESKIVKILPTTYITLMTLKNENKNGTYYLWYDGNIYTV